MSHYQAHQGMEQGRLFELGSGDGEAYAFLSRSGRNDVERELTIAHATFMRWMKRYVPEFESRACELKWGRFGTGLGTVFFARATL
jgi:hypothetical protein